MISTPSLQNKYAKTATLVIDMQNGQMRGYESEENGVLASKNVIETSRAAKIPIIFSSYAGLYWSDYEKAIIGALTYRDNEKIIPKHYIDGFEETNLKGTLDDMEIERIIAIGIRGCNCFKSTVLSALNWYDVIIPKDAVICYCRKICSTLGTVNIFAETSNTHILAHL